MKINIVRPTAVWYPQVFDELCLLLHSSFIELGYNSVISYDSIDNGARNVFISLFFRDKLLSDAPANSILFQVENLLGNTDYSRKQISRAESWAKQFEVWDYSNANLEVMRQVGANRLKFFEFGYSPSICRYSPGPISTRSIDVLFYGTLNEHRARMINALKNLGIHVVCLSGVFGEDRDRVMVDSKIVLNLHGTGSNFEIVRVHYPLNNRLLVVSESNPETQIVQKYKEYVVLHTRDELDKSISELLSDNQKLESLAREKFANFQRSSQTRIIEQLLVQQF